MHQRPALNKKKARRPGHNLIRSYTSDPTPPQRPSFFWSWTTSSRGALPCMHLSYVFVWHGPPYRERPPLHWRAAPPALGRYCTSCRAPGGHGRRKRYRVPRHPPAVEVGAKRYFQAPTWRPHPFRDSAASGRSSCASASVCPLVSV
jgi:hypothetical protein